MTHAIGIIGVGEIASAIVDGLCSNVEQPPTVLLSPRNKSIADELARRHHTVRVCADNQEVIDNAEIVLLTIRPDIVSEVLDNLQVRDDQIVISALAGVSHETLRQSLGERVTIVRAIPLPSVRLRLGVTAIYPAHPEVEQLFDSLGGTLAVDDPEALDAIQATTATISTYLHYLASVATWLAEQGIPDTEAERYVRDMFFGVTAGLPDRARSLPILAAAHETPAGINEQLRRAWFDEENGAALASALDDIFTRLGR